MLKKIIVVLFSLIIVGCTTKMDKYKEIMNDNEYIIIDVRTAEEYTESHVKDSINIPYDDIDENTELDKDKILFVYCKSGARSNVAYQKLKDLGYTVYDMGAYENIDLEKESN